MLLVKKSQYFATNYLYSCYQLYVVHSPVLSGAWNNKKHSAVNVAATNLHKRESKIASTYSIFRDFKYICEHNVSEVTAKND